MNTLLIIHLVCCFLMTGIIWLVQVILYPNFFLVGENEFSAVHRFHTQRITWLVAPLMSLELFTGAWLYLNSPNSFFFWNLVSIVSLWLLTAFVNVPTHNRLKYDSRISKKNLVYRNWPRTLIWTVRSLALSISIGVLK